MAQTWGVQHQAEWWLCRDQVLPCAVDTGLGASCSAFFPLQILKLPCARCWHQACSVAKDPPHMQQDAQEFRQCWGCYCCWCSHKRIHPWWISLKWILGLSKKMSWNTSRCRQVLLSVIDLSYCSCRSWEAVLLRQELTQCACCVNLAPFLHLSVGLVEELADYSWYQAICWLFIPFICVGSQLQRNKWMQ